MKIIFFGTGKFGIPSLEKIIGSKHDLLGVVTRPDRKKGRGWKIQPTAVKDFVLTNFPDINVFQPENSSAEDFINTMKQLEPDIFVVIDYGQILKKELLLIPAKYGLNLHPSLLPKYRGAAPVNRVILNGDKKTGNSVIQLAERMDAGSVMGRMETDINESENALELLIRLSKSGAELMLKVLDEIEQGAEAADVQDEKEATYAPKLSKEEGEIDWTRPASEIINKVRGLKPWPGAYTYLNGKVLKIIEAVIDEKPEEEGTPGEICLLDGIRVKSYDKYICIKTLQAEGKKAMSSDEFLRGHDIKKGTILGSGRKI